MSSPIPVVVCGARAEVAKGVVAGLAPEYEVIYVILTASEGAVVLPSILSGTAPPATDTGSEPNVGSCNYTAPPFAVIAGGGYDDTAVAQMRDSVNDHKTQVIWLRHDHSKPAPPVGPGYSEHVVERVRECLGGLLKLRDWELEKVKGKVVWY